MVQVEVVGHIQVQVEVVEQVDEGEASAADEEQELDTAAIAERVRHYLKANQIQWTRFGDLADNQGEEALQTTAQGAFGQQDIAEGSFLTQVTLPVASGFPETASASDDNGNMICLSSDSVDVEIFPNILSYQEQAAADHLEVKADETNKCRQCGLEFRTRYWLMKHLKQLGHKSLTDCDVCKKKFSNKYTLKAHRDRAHSTESQFACIKCGRRFKDRERCAKHQANDALHQRLERFWKDIN